LIHLTPAPLLQERGYLVDYIAITPLLLKEKGPGDEVDLLEKGPGDEVDLLEKGPGDEVDLLEKGPGA
jgi:hypothetical protein